MCREIVNTVLVRARSQTHLLAHRRHRQHLAEAVGRGPGNRRGVPMRRGTPDRCRPSSGCLLIRCSFKFWLAGSCYVVLHII